MRVLHRPFSKFIEYDKTRISRVIDDNSVVNIHDISYTYDSMSRILSEIDSEVSNYEKTYIYDKLGRLVRENNKYLDKTYIYSYNEIGNITSVEEYSYTTGTASGSYSSKALVYGDASNPDRLTRYGYNDISYDSNGHPVRYGNMILVWDRGKLVKMYEDVDESSCNSKETYEFKYNAYGQRISKIYEYDPGPDYSGDFLIGYDTTYTYDDSGRLIREDREEYYTESASTNYETLYLYDQSDIIGFTIKRDDIVIDTYYFNKNIHGDVTEIYNSSGSAVVKYAYDAFGNCTTLSSSDLLADMILAAIVP